MGTMVAQDAEDEDPKKKKKTRAETTAEKQRLVRKMIDERWFIATIKSAFAKQFGTTPRAAERFITEAYREIRETSEKPSEQHKADSVQFWTRIIQDPKSSKRERMQAQTNLDRVVGNYAPVKVAGTNTSGEDLPPLQLPRKLSRDELEVELSQFAREMQPESDQGAQ